MYETLVGNRNAVKYSDTDVINLLLDICDKARSENCYFILQAIRDKISKAQWDYFLEKYRDNQTVFGMIKNIQAVCECNLVEAMLTGKVKETASIFLLKAKYGYVDRQTVDIEHKGAIVINLQLPEEDTLPPIEILAIN